MEKLLQVLFSASPQGVAFVEPLCNDQQEIRDFRYRMVNKAFSRVLRLTEKELTGQLVSSVLLATESHFLSRLTQVFKSEQPQQLTVDLQRKGQGSCLYVTLTPLDDQVMITIQDITEQKKTERKLQRRLEMESIISSISARLINMDAADLDAYLVEALGQVATFNGADRASIFNFSVDRRVGNCTHEWCAPGIASRKELLQNLPVDNQDWLHDQLATGRVLQLDSTKLPPQAVGEGALFNVLPMRSLMIFPLMQDEKTTSYIGFYAIRQSQSWDENDISLLQTFSSLVANVQKRLKQETAIRRINDRLTGLHTIDQALLSPRSAEHSPLLLALRHINALVPCERLTLFRINKATGLATAEYQIANGRTVLNPDLIFPIDYFLTLPTSGNQPAYLFDVGPNEPGILAGLHLYEQGFRSLLVMPLHSRHKCIGAFTMVSTRPDFFTEEYLNIAQEVASQLAIALYQQQLDEQLRSYTEELEQRVAARTRTITELSTLQQAILKHAGQAILSTDQDGVIRTANQACEKLIGYPADELIGRVTYVQPGPDENPVPCVSFQHPAAGNNAPNFFRAAMAGNGFFNTECVVVGKNGRKVPILLVTSTLQDEDGVVIGYVGIATDISALKAAEANLQQRNREFNTFFTGALDMHCISDTQGNLLKTNQAFRLALGYSEGELMAIPFLYLLHPDEQKFVFQNLLTPILYQPIRNQINRFRKKDGTYRTVEWNAIGIDNLVYGSARDITERQEAEAALRESEQRFREIADNVDEVFWIHSAEPFELLYINSAYERVFGIDPNRLTYGDMSFLDTILEEDRPMVLAEFTKYRQGQEVSVQCRVQGVFTEVRWLQIRTFVTKDCWGNPSRYIGIVNDISSQKETEFILKKSLHREQELNQLKSQFVATASHEFRTPLTAIQTSADLIQLYLEQPPETARPFIEDKLGVIHQQIQNVNSLLSDLLSIGKIEAGKIAFIPRYVDVLALCKQVVSNYFSHQPDGRFVQVSVEGPPHHALLDEKLIRHILTNLLSNAFKFSKENPLLVIRFEPNVLVIQVIDKGIGIPAGDLPGLFQTFFRARNTEAIQGTGLGLVIARQFVELHGGTLNVESEESKGTTFTIQLPIEKTE
ncbi:PAS domain S-box protein [Larkinella insperata]|uniref:histidine kinase n=1 Tax=Larkinella insperata TaxID=332158 RepID=A0ABW3Q4X0_9BACT|nr:PAS domain S-box protein [Larkinella insperata]